MAIKGEKRGEKYFRWGVHILALVFGVIVIVYGLIIKQPCDMDKIYLWCRLHPFQIQDIIGLIFFLGGTVGASGIWMLGTGDVDQTPGRQIVYGSGAAMLFGAILMWI